MTTPAPETRPGPRPRIAVHCRGALVVCVSLAVAVGCAPVRDTVGDHEFENPLRIPPILEPDDEAGTRHLVLAIGEGRTEIFPGRTSRTWGVNGDFLGPTIRVRRGDHLRVDVANRLSETTTLHWHGAHLPAVADGGPHQPIEPGHTWTSEWTVDQPAATLWYHPHPHGDTADHVARGVIGMLIVDDDVSDRLDLPDQYGVDDIPVILHDPGFDDGLLDPSAGHDGPLGPTGDHVLVNGTYDPHVDITTDRARFRLLNASGGRIYHLGFDDDRDFALVATDGGFLERPHVTNRITLSPGERAEIVVEFEPGERPVLRSFPPRTADDRLGDQGSGGRDTFDLLQLRPAAELEARRPVPEQLARWDGPDPDVAVNVRTFSLTGRSRINGQRMDHRRIDAVVAAGSTELWEVSNDSGTIHNFHVHEVQFRVVDYDGAPPPPHLRGPKDTVLVPPRTSVVLAVRFGNHTDPHVPYMFHCHILTHEDAGMMGQFTIVDPDRVDHAPRLVPSSSHH